MFAFSSQILPTILLLLLSTRLHFALIFSVLQFVYLECSILVFRFDFRLKIYPHILFLFSKRCNSHRSFLNYNSHIFRTSIFASFSFFALLFVGNVSQQNCIMPSFFNLYHDPANCKRHEFASKKNQIMRRLFCLRRNRTFLFALKR